MKNMVLFFFMLSTPVWSSNHSELITDFKTLLQDYGITPSKEQTFCYAQEGIQGYRVDELKRIASLTKIFTTYFASETQDLNTRFETRFYVSGDRLHIEGSRDPYFEEEKLLLLMHTLNRYGIYAFKEVTFDNSFLFYDIALEEHKVITPAHTRQRLSKYFNPKYSKFVKSKWMSISKFAYEEGVDIDQNDVPTLTVEGVSLTSANPLLESSPVVYVHRSKPLYAILKAMNVMSKNTVAENIFKESLKVSKFSSFMSSLGIGTKTFKIYNGSGLPIKTAKYRLDNLASCRTVLKVIELLNSKIKKYNLRLSDILAVNGTDLGSFRHRFEEYPETHGAVLGKTGTLMHASALGGILYSATETPFAILNHTLRPEEARKFQDAFVTRLFHHLGTPVPVPYEKISIFPWDNSDFFERSYLLPL